MRTVIDLVLGGEDQELVLDAPEGQPSEVVSVAVARWDAGDDSAIAGVVIAALEATPDAALTAAAGANTSDPRVLEVDDSTGVEVGRTYLLTAPDGRRELVEVDTLEAGTPPAATITAKHPLHGDYAEDSTLVSARIVATVDDAWSADETNIDPTAGANPMYRVRWVYVVDGKTCVADTYFNLVRYPGRHTVRPQDVDNFAPGWLDRLPTDHRADQGVRLIDEGYRAVKMDLHGIAFDDAAIAESEVVDELVRYKTVELTELANYLAGKQDDSGRLTTAERRYATRLEQLIKLAANTPQRDTSGAAAPARPASLSVR